jgi:hypothetical protein
MLFVEVVDYVGCGAGWYPARRLAIGAVHSLKLLPGQVRVECRDRSGGSGSIRTQIFGVHNAKLVHNVRLDSRYSVTQRRGNQTESAKQMSGNKELVRSPNRVRALSGEYSELISEMGTRSGLSRRSR